MGTNNYLWTIEVINDFTKRGYFKSALFDFDGTISLIRQGWHDIMKPYFYEVLIETPGAKNESPESLLECIDDFVDLNTGKQTIFQCMALVEEILKRGGLPQDPIVYKNEYQRRLLENIQYRIEGLESGKFSPVDYVVPGSFELLNAFYEKGINIYLASGTDEKYVLHEAKILGITKYFSGGIYGAQKDYKLFSKKIIINRIIKECNLSGAELIGFGDGFVEIENVKEVGGFAVGVASDELNRIGVNEWKRDRLIKAGADIIIPDYSRPRKLLDYLFTGSDKYAISEI